MIEAYRHLVDDELDDTAGLAASVLERRIVTCKVDVPNVLDLRSHSVRNAVSVTDAQLRSDVGDYAACQTIGAAEPREVGEAYVQRFLEVHAHFRANVLDRQDRLESHELCAVRVACGGEDQIRRGPNDEHWGAHDRKVANGGIKGDARHPENVEVPRNKGWVQKSMLVLV